MRDGLIELLKGAEKKVAEELSRPLALEEWLGIYADHLIANGVILPPCKVGETIYKIVKFCESNTGYKNFYKPSVEFEENCPYLNPQSWYDDCDRCEAVEDYDEGCYCGLNLKIFCDKCKERLAIQKDKFTFAKMKQVYGTPMFDETTLPEDRYYLTMEEAEKCLKEKENGI
jgi:hypothetical protein